MQRTRYDPCMKRVAGPSPGESKGASELLKRVAGVAPERLEMVAVEAASIGTRLVADLMLVARDEPNILGA